MSEHYHDAADLRLLKEMKKLAPAEFDAWAGLDGIVKLDGAIPRKYRELIAIAVAVHDAVPLLHRSACQRGEGGRGEPRGDRRGVTGGGGAARRRRRDARRHGAEVLRPVSAGSMFIGHFALGLAAKPPGPPRVAGDVVRGGSARRSGVAGSARGRRGAGADRSRQHRVHAAGFRELSLLTLPAGARRLGPAARVGIPPAGRERAARLPGDLQSGRQPLGARLSHAPARHAALSGQREVRPRSLELHAADDRHRGGDVWRRDRGSTCAPPVPGTRPDAGVSSRWRRSCCWSTSPTRSGRRRRRCRRSTGRR